MGASPLTPIADAIGKLLTLAVKVIAGCFIAVGIGALLARLSFFVF